MADTTTTEKANKLKQLAEGLGRVLDATKQHWSSVPTAWRWALFVASGVCAGVVATPAGAEWQTWAVNVLVCVATSIGVAAGVEVSSNGPPKPPTGAVPAMLVALMLAGPGCAILRDPATSSIAARTAYVVASDRLDRLVAKGLPVAEEQAIRSALAVVKSWLDGKEPYEVGAEALRQVIELLEKYGHDDPWPEDSDSEAGSW